LRKTLNDFGPLEEPLLRKASRGVLKGLNYLHTHSPPVVHRDLKAANILVDLNFCVKLADFGCSKRDVSTQSWTTVGSVYWIAPEVVTNVGHSRKADIWSFGCVVVEMVTGTDPWGKNAFDNVMQAVQVIGFTDRTPPVPEQLCDSGKDLLRLCLSRDPKQRPRAHELLEHDLVSAKSAASNEGFGGA